MGQVVAKSKCDIVLDDIIEQIAGNVYPLGSRLPAETELSTKYGVSRITIRESLKKLSSMGIVDIQQGKGTFVSNVDIGAFMAPLLPLIEFEDFDITTIYDARQYIESATCRLAARNRTKEDIERLVQHVDQMDECVLCGNMIGMVELDVRFHIEIAEVSRNQILKAIVINLERLSAACAKQLKKTHILMDEVNVHHRNIVQAIERGDEYAAEAAMVEHSLRAKEFLISWS